MVSKRSLKLPHQLFRSSSALGLMVSAFFALILAGPLASQTSFPTGTVGTYTALLDRHPWYNGGFGGLLKLTVTSSGSYSGRITRGMHSKAFKGKLRFHEDGITPIGSFAVTRVKPYNPLEVTFSLPVGASEIQGTLREPGGETINLSGYRHGFSKSQPATSFAGAWNLIYDLKRPYNSQTGSYGWPFGDLRFPQGSSWAIQKVSASGVINWAGRLADGTSLTYSTGLSQNGRSLLHVMLYSNYGSVQASQTLNATNGTASGTGNWYKWETKSGRNYVQGFPLHDLNGVGGRYTPPAKGEQLLGITPSIANIILGITDWAVEVFDGISFTLWHDNRIFMPVLGSAGNLPRITLRADLKTGIVTGKVGALGYNSYMPSLARSGTFSALISPQAAIEGSPTHCRGHVIIPARNDPRAPIHSYLIETF
jgi:hypothetical protein